MIYYCKLFDVILQCMTCYTMKFTHMNGHWSLEVLHDIQIYILLVFYTITISFEFREFLHVKKLLFSNTVTKVFFS